MRLLRADRTTAETTLAGTTAGALSTLGSGSAGGLRVRKIIAYGASSVAENTSGGMNFVYGDSSADVHTTLTILPGPTSVATVVYLDTFDIYTRWFEARTNEAGAGGYAIFVFGD